MLLLCMTHEHPRVSVHIVADLCAICEKYFSSVSGDLWVSPGYHGLPEFLISLYYCV
jgi:hypothetical protein